MLLLIIGLLLFVGLVVIHEFGHFIAARRAGVDVEEFGIGFPPRLFGRRMSGGWLFSINLLPVGGFVRLKGEHDADIEKGTFGAASLWSKTKIMAAGVVMNLVVAFIFFTALAWVGTPVLVCNQYKVASDTHYSTQGDAASTITGIESGSPASKIGLKKGDRLVAAGPSASDLRSISPECPLSDITQQYAGQSLTVQVQRGGQTLTKTATLLTKQEVDDSLSTKNPKGYLGITVSNGLRFARATWSAPVVAAGEMVQFTGLTFQGLGKAVAGLGGIVAGEATGNSHARSEAQKQASSQVSGPLGIFFVLKGGAALGFKFVLFIVAIISLTLAIMNILPIPALDGGRLWLMLISHAVGKPLSQRTEEMVAGIGFMVLMLLFILITIVDVKRFL
jgi:regulator of sigma E protease